MLVDLFMLNQLDSREDREYSGSGVFQEDYTISENQEVKEMNLIAVLSSTVINVSGKYDVQVSVEMPDIKGLPSYVGHPDTAAVLEKLGVNKVSGLFAGLEVGQSFLAVPLSNPNRDEGWTVDQALSSLSELRVTIVTRVG